MPTLHALLAEEGTFQVDEAGDRQRLPEQRLLQILLEKDRS